MINTIQIALSGLTAASRKVEASASNIANATTSGAIDPADGPAPYDPLTTVQATVTDQQGRSLGVSSGVVSANRPFVPSYEPDSPFANSEGLVARPDVNLAEDIVHLQIASASYKANLKTIETASEMQNELLNIFDKKI